MVRRANAAEGEPACDRLSRIPRSIVDDDYLVARIPQLLQRTQAFFERLRRVVRSHHHRHFGPSSLGGERNARVESALHHLIGWLRPTIGIDESETPIIDQCIVLVKWIRPAKDNRASEAVVEYLLNLPVQKGGLLLPPVT